MPLTHAVIIRMKYPPGDPRWPWRFGFFRDEVLPRILAQTDREFDLWLRCNTFHAPELRRLHPKVQTFSGTMPPGRYEIQTRTDTDDYLEPGYIAKIKAVVRAEAQGQPLLVSFQPWKVLLATGQKYRQRQFGPQEPSMFLSLYQPSGPGPYVNIYATKHTLMHRFCPRVAIVPEGYCSLLIHDQNDFSKLHKGDKPL